MTTSSINSRTSLSAAGSTKNNRPSTRWPAANGVLPPSLRRASFVIRSFENVGPWPLCQREAFSDIKRQIGNGRSGQRLDDLELNRTPRFECHTTGQNA